jgi:hypothetical protein
VSAAARQVEPPAWTPADDEALRRALDAAGPSELPGQSVGDYLMGLAAWLRDLFLETIGRALPTPGWTVVENVALYVVLCAAAIGVVAFFAAAFRRFRRRSKPQPEGTPVEAASPGANADAEWWGAELTRRLEGGAWRAALEALWWWVARRLDPPGLDPSWTTGDLLHAGGAAPLREPLRRLERLQWGGAEPRREDVEAVVSALREALR